ncbi:hypothetical protein NQ317_011918 [Molorchus minor]|uniref:MADF domain-containing protein n=1 Tax=Molorchus minor TaxID=1323400 RepID=A0ABQ9JIV4_9CUCU|nr:hypothetical protein NQ317_011918 [Molorchus minor]
MDSEKLISLVYENRCLWDMKNKQYHNRDISRKTWEKISKEMNANITAIKGRWRGLRDTFRKELSKLPKKRSGDEGGPTIKPAWPYYENLLFLKDQFASRTLNSNIPDVNSVGNSDTEENEDAIETVTQDTFEAEDHNSTQDICSILMNHKLLLIMSIYQIKVHQGKPPNNLLPYLRKVKEDRKMIVRMKLQQVFCDEDVLQQQEPLLGTYVHHHMHPHMFQTPHGQLHPHNRVQMN